MNLKQKKAESLTKSYFKQNQFPSHPQKMFIVKKTTQKRSANKAESSCFQERDTKVILFGNDENMQDDN